MSGTLPLQCSALLFSSVQRLHLPFLPLTSLTVFKNVLVGASKGVGKAMACCFAREGAHLILVASPETKDDCKQVTNLS